MKILGVNGSPRKQGNTAVLLHKALEGAASQGAETELIHLYDYNYKGCISCFACKTKDGISYGRCAVKDDLRSILNKVEGVDAILLGSPIYFSSVTGEMRSFMERLLFPYLAYTNPPQSLFNKKINIGFIYTMNIPEDKAKEMDYEQKVSQHEMAFKMLFGGNLESLYSFDTYQFKDYSKVVAELFDPEQKAKRREEIFPEDCNRAVELGARLAASN
ncbi:flavodoxin family protein [Desulforamulus aquiferis]|uniref:Flavodoxin family protein n=1 Tax=Desulforamulus aquiferis TaxID=1397668 RepID=A0AAW7ZDD4_9FIRM|nr:flavodoxin family protein [Desulforamulus aquiferis]MDO7787342.1 flavodoxin family protein [Desulforamulus aquiferis]